MMKKTNIYIKAISLVLVIAFSITTTCYGYSFDALRPQGVVKNTLRPQATASAISDRPTQSKRASSQLPAESISDKKDTMDSTTINGDIITRAMFGNGKKLHGSGIIVQPGSPDDIRMFLRNPVGGNRRQNFRSEGEGLIPTAQESEDLTAIRSGAALRQAIILIDGERADRKSRGRAEQILRKAIAEDPKNYKLLTKLADLLRKIYRYDKAMEEIKKALAIKPKNVPSLIVYAKIFMDLDKGKRALKQINRALSYEPKSIGARIVKAEILLYKLNLPDEALPLVEEVLHERPGNPSALYVKAKILIAKKDKRALEISRRLVKLKPDQPKPYLLYAEALLLCGRFDEAIKTALAVKDMQISKAFEKKVNRFFTFCGICKWKYGKGIFKVNLPDEPAVTVEKFEGNSILLPDPAKERNLLNPGAIKIKDKFCLAIRSADENNNSCIYLAVSDDGYNFTRCLKPIYDIHPQINKKELKNVGYEDPRLSLIDDKIFMHFTFYDGCVPQVAESYISVEDFISGNKDKWSSMKLLSPGVKGKNFVIIPKAINGIYYAFNRPELPNGERVGRGIHLSFLDIDGRWKDKGMVIKPKKGCWVGPGTILETEGGWLLIYHEASQKGLFKKKVRYVLKLLLLDKENPEKVLYAPDESILEPTKEDTAKLEAALGRKSWVPNVVFSNGAVIKGDEDVLKVGSQVIVYYGLNDTAICAATITINREELIKPLSPAALSEQAEAYPAFGIKIKNISKALSDKISIIGELLRNFFLCIKHLFRLVAALLVRYDAIVFNFDGTIKDKFIPKFILRWIAKISQTHKILFLSSRPEGTKVGLEEMLVRLLKEFGANLHNIYVSPESGAYIYNAADKKERADKANIMLLSQKEQGNIKRLIGIVNMKKARIFDKMNEKVKGEFEFSDYDMSIFKYQATFNLKNAHTIEPGERGRILKETAIALKEILTAAEYGFSDTFNSLFDINVSESAVNVIIRGAGKERALGYFSRLVKTELPEGRIAKIAKIADKADKLENDNPLLKGPYSFSVDTIDPENLHQISLPLALLMFLKRLRGVEATMWLLEWLKFTKAKTQKKVKRFIMPEVERRLYNKMMLRIIFGAFFWMVTSAEPFLGPGDIPLMKWIVRGFSIIIIISAIIAYRKSLRHAMVLEQVSGRPIRIDKNRPVVAVFDVHGTLVKPNWKMVYALAYSRLTGRGMKKAERWVKRNAVNMPERKVIQLLVKESGNPVRIVKQCLSWARRHVYHNEIPELMPNVLEFIKALHEKGVPIVIISGSRHSLIVKHLKEHGFLDFIPDEMIIGIDDIKTKHRSEYRKLAVEMVKRHFSEYEILSFDDWIESIGPVKAAGGGTFGLPQGKGKERRHNRKRLIEANVDFILDGWKKWQELLDMMEIKEDIQYKSIWPTTVHGTKSDSAALKDIKDSLTETGDGQTPATGHEGPEGEKVDIGMPEATTSIGDMKKKILAFSKIETAA